jgi:hypothetical protein
MEAMTERSVNGTVDLDYAVAGVTWRLTCPAPNALEPWELEQNLVERKSRTTGDWQTQDANNGSQTRTYQLRTAPS